MAERSAGETKQKSEAEQALHDTMRLQLLYEDPAAHPRVIAIVAASYLELYLEKLIIARMPGLDAELRKRLFDVNGSVSSLGAKIDMARALDLIRPYERINMIQIARVRNRFAHDLEIATFDHVKVRKCVDAMVTDRYDVPGPDGALVPLASLDDYRRRFCFVANITATFLAIALQGALFGPGPVSAMLETAEHAL
jgi:hypothetical protein